MIKYIIDTQNPDIKLDEYILEEGYIFLTAIEQNQCKGVLAFEVIESVMHIRYIYVDEAFRKKGIATELVKKAGEYGRENQLQGIVWTVAVEHKLQAETTRFLIRNGFHIPECEEITVSVQLDSMEKSYLADLPLKTDGLDNHLYRMDKLPPVLRTDYELHIKPDISAACHLTEVRGELISDLSFALERNGKIMAYVLFSDVQGELYLNAVYSNAKNATDLIKLLKYCLGIVKQKFSKYKVLKVTLINKEGTHLFDTLIKGGVLETEVVLMSFKTL